MGFRSKRCTSLGRSLAAPAGFTVPEFEIERREGAYAPNKILQSNRKVLQRYMGMPSSVLRDVIRNSARKFLPTHLFEKGAERYNRYCCKRSVNPDDYEKFDNQLYGKRNNTPGVPEKFRVVGVQYPLYARSGTPDAEEIVHSVVREAYGKYLPDGDVKFVIDAGAYIGDTAAWYLSKFPASRVVALEPNPETFAMLQMNCSPYGPRVKLINGALWYEDAELDLVFDPTTPTGNSVAQHETLGSNRCTAVSVHSILEQAGADEIDIFKIDIEGAELELFTQNPDPWLSRTRYITMEIHSP